MTTYRPNPVHRIDGKWYFWDEVWVDRLGPYDTEEEAEIALLDYCIKELGYGKH